MKPYYTQKSSLSVSNEQRYSEEEQEHYQAIFAQAEQKDRRMWRKALLILFICLGIYYFVGTALSSHPIANAFWMIGLFVIPLPALTPVLLSSDELKCPACRKNLFRTNLEVGDYCPECGAYGLKLKEGWFSYWYCESCHKHFNYLKGRIHRIRACTYCGLLFSKKRYR